MTVNSQRLLLAAAGAGGAAAAAGLYVDDVFSCVVWDGHPTGGEQDIDAGIDLTEGGLVWAKARDASDHHYLVDSEIGKTGSYYDNLATSLTGSVVTNEVYGVETFNNNGFTVDGSNARLNDGSKTYVSWVFKETPGFFDIVKYTGNSTAGHSVAHDLGSVPGCIIIKKLGGGSDWFVYHRGTGNTKTLRLNETDGEIGGAWDTTDPTSTHFTLGTNTQVNESGQQYIAYIFAHDDQSFGTDEDESIIKCGSYTGNNNSNGPTVDLGWEPQWVLIKGNGDTAGWGIFDSMRGVETGGAEASLLANSSTTENGSGLGSNNFIDFTPTGFKFSSAFGLTNGSLDYVYIAIRRPHKPPSAATEVFATDSQNSGPYNAAPYYRSGFVVDAQLLLYKTGTSSAFPWLSSRLTGIRNLVTALASAEDNNSTINKWDFMNGFSGGEIFSDDSNHVSHMFRRAPGFFDVVTYSGNSTDNRAIAHNLTVKPELLITYGRNFGGGAGFTIVPDLSINEMVKLTSDAAKVASFYGDDSSNQPTATHYKVGNNNDINETGRTYITYMFATLAGISKVGSYSGTGSNIGVDCGFTAGARFVVIKRFDSTGDWYVYDSHRGIVGGNDPYLLLNEYDAEVTNTDYIDPLNSGFTVTSSAPAALNASGGTYIFLAIA
jgi:hypothetical protein